MESSIRSWRLNKITFLKVICYSQLQYYHHLTEKPRNTCWQGKAFCSHLSTFHANVKVVFEFRRIQTSIENKQKL